MSDETKALIARLELWAEKCQREDRSLHASVMRDAADEIERLRAENARLREALEPFVRSLQMQEAENKIKRLPLPNDTNRLIFALVGDARRARATLSTAQKGDEK
jgi:type IV secretory pathway VirB4 component